MLSSLSRAALAVSVVFPLLAVSAVAARIHARRVRQISLGSDDWVIIATLIVTLAMGILAIWASVAGGIGLPLQSWTPDITTKFLKQLWVNELLPITAIGLVKISVLLFYRRIFTTRTFRLVANTMIAIVSCWTLAIFLALTFSILPVSDQWNINSPRNNSLNFAALLMAMGTTDIVLDIAILFFPLPMIYRLQMSTQRKVMLAGLFWLGAFCVVASAVRLVYLVKFLAIYAPNVGFESLVPKIIIWSEIEPCASIIAACLPTLRPLFKGGRTPASLIASIRSYISLSNYSDKRKGSQLRGSSGLIPLAGEKAREWNKVDRQSETATTVGAELRDLDRGREGGRSGIMVDKTFGPDFSHV